MVATRVPTHLDRNRFDCAGCTGPAILDAEQRACANRKKKLRFEADKDLELKRSTQQSRRVVLPDNGIPTFFEDADSAEERSC